MSGEWTGAVFIKIESAGGVLEGPQKGPFFGYFKRKKTYRQIFARPERGKVSVDLDG